MDAAIKGGAAVVRTQIADGHGVHFSRGVAVPRQGGVVGGENAKRPAVVEEHRHRVGLQESAAETGSVFLSRCHSDDRVVLRRCDGPWGARAEGCVVKSYFGTEQRGTASKWDSTTPLKPTAGL